MSLGTFLFSDYRRKVLALLLLHANEHYHQREIARLTATISGTLSRELAKMVAVGLLLKTQVGNQIHYTANQQSPIFEELASILRKTDGWVQALADALEPLASRINSAFVFGSMASGKANPGSDIDLMVIGEVAYGDLLAQLYPLQEALGREINPKQFAPSEWRQLVEEGGTFVTDVLSNPLIVVMGEKPTLSKV